MNVVEEMVIEEPIAEGTLLATDPSTAVEGSVAKNMVKKEMEVHSLLVKLLGVEDL